MSFDSNVAAFVRILYHAAVTSCYLFVYACFCSHCSQGSGIAKDLKRHASSCCLLYLLIANVPYGTKNPVFLLRKSRSSGVLKSTTPAVSAARSRNEGPDEEGANIGPCTCAFVEISPSKGCSFLHEGFYVNQSPSGVERGSGGGHSFNGVADEGDAEQRERTGIVFARVVLFSVAHCMSLFFCFNSCRSMDFTSSA